MADLRARIAIKHMLDDALERDDTPLASILEVAIRTLDARIKAAPNLDQTGAAPPFAALVGRNVRIGGRRMTLKLERAFWDMLQRIAESNDDSIDAICTAIGATCDDGNLASAIRVYVLKNCAQPKGYM